MYRYDYILRLIEQLTRVLIALRNRILQRELQPAEVRDEITQLARLAGLDLEIARQLDPSTLMAWLAPTGDVDEAKFWLMAELLYLEGLAAREAGRADRGEPELRRALVLLTRLPADWKAFDDLASAGERVAEIRQLIPDR